MQKIGWSESIATGNVCGGADKKNFFLKFKNFFQIDKSYQNFEKHVYTDKKIFLLIQKILKMKKKIFFLLQNPFSIPFVARGVREAIRECENKFKFERFVFYHFLRFLLIFIDFLQMELFFSGWGHWNETRQIPGYSGENSEIRWGIHWFLTF